MKLEVGKKYKTVKGKIVKIIDYAADKIFHKYIGDDGLSRGENGRGHSEGDILNTIDLVEEVVEDKPFVWDVISSVWDNKGDDIYNDLEGGKKYDEGKPEFDRLSFQALGEFNRVHKAGDAKYAEGNWREGIDIKRLINAAIRHLTAILDGELTDKETKTLHSANAGVNCEMVTHYLLNADQYKDYIKLPRRPDVK